MQEFIANALHFPTIVFSVLLVVALLYWLLALLGIFGHHSVEGDVHGDVHADAHDGNELGGLAGFLLHFGLEGVPITIVFSVLSLVSWVICYLLSLLLLGYVSNPFLLFLAGTVVLVSSFFLSLPFTARIVRPLKKLLVVHTAVEKSALVGRPCTVRTGEVTSTFGQAELHDGEAGMLLNIRASEPNDYKKGDCVVIISYDAHTDSYQVVSDAQFGKD